MRGQCIDKALLEVTICESRYLFNVPAMSAGALILESHYNMPRMAPFPLPVALLWLTGLSTENIRNTNNYGGAVDIAAGYDWRCIHRR